MTHDSFAHTESLEGVSQVLDSYFFASPSHVFSIIYSFVAGLIFSPFSQGIKYFTIYLLLNEFVFAFVTRMRAPYWTIECRSGSVAASFMGFVIGRQLVGYKNPLDNHDLTDQRKKDLKDQLEKRNKMLDISPSDIRPTD